MAPTKLQDPFGARGTFDLGSGPETIYRLAALEEATRPQGAGCP